MKQNIIIHRYSKDSRRAEKVNPSQRKRDKCVAVIDKERAYTNVKIEFNFLAFPVQVETSVNVAMTATSLQMSI